MTIREGRGVGRVTIIADGVRVIAREIVAFVAIDEATSLIDGESRSLIYISGDPLAVKARRGDSDRASVSGCFSFPVDVAVEFLHSILDEDLDVVWTQQAERTAFDDDGRPITVPPTWRRTPDR